MITNTNMGSVKLRNYQQWRPAGPTVANTNSNSAPGPEAEHDFDLPSRCQYWDEGGWRCASRSKNLAKVDDGDAKQGGADDFNQAVRSWS